MEDVEQLQDAMQSPLNGHSSPVCVDNDKQRNLSLQLSQSLSHQNNQQQSQQLQQVQLNSNGDVVNGNGNNGSGGIIGNSNSNSVVNGNVNGNGNGNGSVSNNNNQTSGINNANGQQTIVLSSVANNENNAKEYHILQVNPAPLLPQYATVTPATAAHNNGGTVYLTTDYITYRDYYSTTPQLPNNNSTTDQYQTVRQHLSSSPVSVTYTQANESVSSPAGETSFLDRYLRQQPVTSTPNGIGIGLGINNGINIGNSIQAYKQTSQLHNGGLTVDLPSPDSGIGEATVTPRGENGALPQVR